eukprot:13945243-Alexandrium_andersonii.AAC.1
MQGLVMTGNAHTPGAAHQELCIGSSVRLERLQTARAHTRAPPANANEPALPQQRPQRAFLSLARPGRPQWPMRPVRSKKRQGGNPRT